MTKKNFHSLPKWGAEKLLNNKELNYFLFQNLVLTLKRNKFVRKGINKVVTMQMVLEIQIC